MARNVNTGINLDLHPSIHCTGNVKGMKKLGCWGKNDICVRIGNYIYNLSITLKSSKQVLV
jgi:hypothetical protein